MQRCPCCRARLKEGPTCPRCKADLSQVHAVEQATHFWYQQAVEFWLKEEPLPAANALNKSLQFKKTELGLAFQNYIIDQQCEKTVALLLAGDFSKAEQTIASVQTLQVNDFQKQLYLFTKSAITKTRISSKPAACYRSCYLKLRESLLLSKIGEWLTLNWQQLGAWMFRYSISTNLLKFLK